ncbi:MAG: NADH-quinone oxidoreductase subunit J [Candidatus Marsarchaeota archaeon]|nr:NADH-quinone oxidoreductase subunit J [Candidatus Marsarchaeota archaeon]MCL5412851.1 NADH-quinone oxidoreductase subunit J [Candidatus Marsarchaeota archaeon]
MIGLYVFYAIAALVITSSILVFVQKRLIHAVIALAVVFFGSALVFFIIGQTLVALLQLVVFVGGFSTYLIVAVATEEKNARLIRFPVFAVLSVLLFAGIVFALQGIPSQQFGEGNNFLTAAASALATDYAMLYIMAALLFAATIGGVMIIKKFTKLLI